MCRQMMNLEALTSGMYSFYRVVLRAGHMGRGRSHEMLRYMKARSFAELCTAIHSMPRVKKGSANALVDARRISGIQYLCGRGRRHWDFYQTIRRNTSGLSYHRIIRIHRRKPAA